MFLKIRKHLICVTVFVFLTLLCVICTMTFTQGKQTSFATEMEVGNFRVYDDSGVFHSGYDDIGSAWTAAKRLSFDNSSEVTVKMFADAEVADTLNIDNRNYNIALDLNGHKLSISESGKYVIESIGTFTLSDSNPTATNSITSYARGSSPETVEISGGVITGANAYAAVYISSGYFNMHGGNIAGNVMNSVNGAAVKPGATFNMTGGTITENVNTAGGIGGLHAQWTKFNVSGAVKIDGNTSCTNIDDSERAESNYGYDYNSSIVINGALNDGAGNKTRIGITLMSDYASLGAVITKDYKTYHAGEAANTYFYSDNSQKCPQFDYYKEVAFYNHGGFENYTNEGDKHSADCKKCGARVTSEHSYSSSTGKCACGAQAAASVGNSYYSELSQAWAAAKTAATATIKIFIDVTITQVLGVFEDDNSNVTLDLNGHTVNGIAGSVSIQIEGGENTFTLKDSKGGGKLTGGAGGICIAKGATVNMESGEISGNSSEFGGGVYINGGTFNMRGGTIKENTAQISGGGVYLSGGTFTVSGSVQISGNFVDSKANNVQVGGGEFTVSGELAENTRIYVYMGSAGDVATGYSQSDAPTNYFISDNEQLNCIYNDNGTIKFAAHDFENSTKYRSTEEEHWKVCKNCTVEDDDNKTAHSGGTATCQSKADCEYCGTAYGELGAHSWNDGVITKQPTCVATGVKYFTCAHNSEHTKTEEIAIDSSNHNWSEEWTTDANIHHHVCLYGCTAVDGLGNHTCGEWEIIVKPTCSTQGSKKHVCTVCEYEITEAIAKDADAHSFGTLQNKVAATCTTAGTKAHKDCTLCNKHFDNENAEITDLTIAVDADAHTFGDWTEIKPADCTHKGEETRVCANNSMHKETRETDATGHSWNPEPVRVEPTCTADGSVTDTCTVCGETDTGVLLKLGHDLVRREAQAATCTEKGWAAYETCSRCDHSTYAETSALGHDFETEFTVDIAATCTEKGSQSKHCTRCDEKTETTEIPLAPHTMTHVERVEATTAANGNIEYWSCSVCEKKFSDVNGTAEIDSVIIPKLKAELVYGGEREIVVAAPNGFAPDIELVVTEIENYAQYESIAQTVNGEINLAYDVTLKSNGVTIQPDGTLTIKLRIPENLQGKNFNLFHLYGSETTDMEYTVDGDFAVVNTDRLSQFIFVGEKAAPVATPEQGLSAGAIAGISVGVIVAVLLVAYVAMYFTLYRKGVLKGKAFGAIYAPMNAIFDKKKQS